MTVEVVAGEPAVKRNPPEPSAASAPPAGSTTFLDRHWRPLVAGAMSLPFAAVLLAFRAQEPRSSNFGDVAVTELAIQKALRFRQVVGPYDRFGWSHPGPGIFYILAIPYAVLGRQASGVLVGAFIVNFACAVGIIALLGRRAGPKAAIGGAVIICTFMALIGVQDVTGAWSPVLITFPAALFFVLCADVASGATWTLVPALVVGSVLAQTEVGLAGVLVVGLGGAICVHVIARLRGTATWDHRTLARVAIASLLVMIVLWTAPIYQQVTGRYGNLGLILQFFLRHHGHHTLSESFTSLSNGMLVGLGPSHVGARLGPVPGYEVGLAMLLTGTVAAAAACHRREQRLGRMLSVVIVGAAVVYCISLLRVQDPLYGYLVLWTRSLTLCAALAAMLAIVAPRRGARRWTTHTSVAGSVLLVASLAGAAAQVVDEGARAPTHRAYGTLSDAAAGLAGVMRTSPHQILMCVSSATAWPYAAGVAADLIRQGWDVTVEERWLHAFGDALAPTGQERAAVFVDMAGTQPTISVSPDMTKTAGGMTFRVYVPSASTQPPVSSTLCPAVPDSSPAPRYAHFRLTHPLLRPGEGARG